MLTVAIFPVLIMAYILSLHIYSKKRYGFSLKETRGLSWSAKQILAVYHSLPPDNRPYANILHIVKALDVKFPDADSHFHIYDYKAFHKSGHSHCYECYTGRCSHEEYSDLYYTLQGVVDELADYEYQMKVVGVADWLEAQQLLMEQLRTELKIIGEVKTELAGKSGQKVGLL